MEFNVPKMSCSHCVASIESSVIATDPAAEVACDLTTHRVNIESTLTAEDLAVAIREAGYDAEPVSAA